MVESQQNATVMAESDGDIVVSGERMRREGA
jgi:hypothetical protein